MSFVSTTSPHGFSLENDTGAHPVASDSFTSESQPRDRIPLNSELLSPFMSQADNDFLIHHGSADLIDSSASASGRFQHDRLCHFGNENPFGISFSHNGGGAPIFPDDEGAWGSDMLSTAFTTIQQHVNETAAFPLTPEQTASIYGVTPRSSDQRVAPLVQPDSISPQQFHNAFALAPTTAAAPRTGLSLDSSGRSSEDGLAPGPHYTTSRSPQVTVSVWDKDDDSAPRMLERSFDNGPVTEIGSSRSTGDLRFSSRTNALGPPPSQPRDSMGSWQRDPATGLRGIDPSRRNGGDVASINEIARQHERDEKNQQVSDWVAQNTQVVLRVQEQSADEILAIEEQNRITKDTVPLGSGTENRYISGQTYYHHGAEAQLTEEDQDIILKNRNWADAPILHGIQDGVPGQNQPQSSQAAIERFEKMCRDNDSIISRAATWGTRRRSLPSVNEVDIDGITSGNFLKKLSISRNSGSGSKSGSLLRDLRGLVRRPSAATIRKRSRSRSGQADAPPDSQQQQQQQQQQTQQRHHQQQPQDHQASEEPAKREAIAHLSPVSRTTSWGKKPTPSINEALVSMGQNFASIGVGSHSRSGSVSNLPPAAPSKSSLSGLGVRTSLRRQRSKSELPPKPPGSGETHSNLADLWWRSGGPPVAPMVSRAQAEPDEDEDEDDESFEDNDMRMNPNLIDDITPNLAGFQMHIQALNPSLGGSSYLVERIAQHQVVRYKQLLISKVRHLGQGAHCPSGSLCLAMNGSPILPDPKGGVREPDSLSASLDDADLSALEGAVNQDSFPADIPMPPTSRLPAEFECQLCFQHKKLNKPSDWTKHVHEDVQPFTCTWKGCRDPKMFKRKADWVRHENEGHRHLEWWACDVDDCRHVCYRRDNFLQHLVREHKFIEPRVKNKAALKKAIGVDPTWRKVEECHKETTSQPQDEPCKFCGKVLPTWKKLTVHLAKHMEQIALPVLRLVEAKAKDLDANTVISPIHDLPLRQDVQSFGELRPRGVSSASAVATATTFDISRLPITPELQGSFAFRDQQAVFGQIPELQAPGQAPLVLPLVPHSGQFQPAFFSQAMMSNAGQGLELQSSTDFVGQPSQGILPDMEMGPVPEFMQPGGIEPHSYLMGTPGQGLVVDDFLSTNGLDINGLDINGLGLQNVVTTHAGGPLMFDGVMEISSGNGSPFSGQDSFSPYSRSPRPQAGMWEDVRYAGL